MIQVSFAFWFKKIFPRAEAQHLQNLILSPPLLPKPTKQAKLPACIYPTAVSSQYSIICREGKSKQKKLKNT